MIELIADFPDKIIGMVGRGEVTAEDYETVFIPVVEDRLKTYDKVRLFYFLGPEFTGYTPRAIWDDTKLGIRHPTGFEKVAVVSDVHWVIQATHFMAMVLPCPVRHFPNVNF